MDKIAKNLSQQLQDEENLGAESKVQLVRWIQCLCRENIALKQQLAAVTKAPPQATCFSFWRWLLVGWWS